MWNGLTLTKITWAKQSSVKLLTLCECMKVKRTVKVIMSLYINTIKFNFHLTLTNEGSAKQVRLQPYRIALKIMYKKRLPIFHSGILSGFQCFAF